MVSAGTRKSAHKFCLNGIRGLARAPYCPAPLSILLATFTPLSPFTYFAMPR
jgi:hypothetical protein